jgi:signal transduction histidine kinase
VLGSYDQQTQYLRRLNRLLLMLGLAAILTGSLLVSLLSHAFTRPLANLVAGVRALQRGDFHHPLDSRGRDEVAELTRVFKEMRSNLLKTQQDLLEAEQLATIGRMASSISHDLRHSMSAITANAEFLSEGGLSREQREELYAEVRAGVRRMTDLIDSLLEFARTRESLSPAWGNVRVSVEAAIQAVRKLPRHTSAHIEAHFDDARQAYFDGRRLERAVFNLVLNACDAAPEQGGLVQVDVSDTPEGTAIAVSDNGPGIAEAIRETMFYPFVSYGKQNGTGLGLTIAQKIVHDHGGSINMERRGGRTVFQMVLPYPPFGSPPGTVMDQKPLRAVTELSQTEGQNRA